MSCSSSAAAADSASASTSPHVKSSPDLASLVLAQQTAAAQQQQQQQQSSLSSPSKASILRRTSLGSSNIGGSSNNNNSPTFARKRIPSVTGPSPGRLFHHRKMSFPAAVSSTSSAANSANSAHASADELGALAANRRMRRFSNVSDAVSRKLSTTIGWRTVSVQDIVSQAKSLCGQYIRCRLKRAGLFTRKLGLQRLRSAVNLQAPGGIIVGEVFGQLQSIGLELERLHPKLYNGVCRQVS